MVFDYAEHDLTGLMDATRHSALRPDQVRSRRVTAAAGWGGRSCSTLRS